MSDLKLKQEVSHLRKHLKNLVAVCESVIKDLDAQMKTPASMARGAKVAMIINRLELQKDLTKRFGLGVVT